MTMEITHIRIGLHPDNLHGSNDVRPTLPEDVNNYRAEAIEDGDKFNYRVEGTTVGITEDEASKVIMNPSLYYFSTALKLHLRIKRAKEGNLVSS